MPSLRFLFEFSWSDLKAPWSRATTIVNVATVAILYFLALTTFGVFCGYERIKQARLASNPSALCLWLGQKSPVESRVTKRQLQSLRETLPARLDAADRLKGISEFRREEFRFISAGAQAESLQLDRQGRTIADGDALFERLTMAWGRPFRSSNEPGVLVSQGLLRDLRYGLKPDAEPIPKVIRINTQLGKVLELEIVGVLQDRLANDDQFIINDGYRRKLLPLQKDYRVRTVYFGPVGATWPDSKKLPEDLKSFFDKRKIKVPKVVRYRDAQYWKLEGEQAGQPEGPNLSAWNYQLKSLERMLGEDFPPLVSTEVLPIGRDPPESEEQDFAPHCGVVYLSELQDVRTTGALCNEMGIVFDREVYDQLVNLANVTQGTFWLIVGVFLVLTLLGLMNLCATQRLIIRQKTGAIGMLKAVGLGTVGLLLCFVVETAIVWLMAVVLAVPTVVFTGPYVADKILAPNAIERALVFPVDGGHLFWAALAVLGICQATVFFSVVGTCRQSPLQSLADGVG